MPTKTKRKTTIKAKRPPVNTKKTVLDEKIKLSNQVEKHKNTIQTLKSQVSEQNKLIKSIDFAKSEIASLSETKEHLKVYISQNSSKEKASNKILKDLTTQKNELDTYIEKVGPKMKTFKGELHELEKQKQGSLAELESINSDTAKIQSEISNLEEMRKGVDQDIKEFETQYALYPRDMKNMFRDAKTQLKSYGALAGVSAGVTLFLMAFVLVSVFIGNPMIDQMVVIFSDQPNLQFYSMLTITIATIGAFSFLIYLFLNLTKNFVSQYINIRNRITTLRVTDYLVTRFEQTKKDKNEQSNVANKYIQEIMRFGNSFDQTKKRK
ncbi:MAG: hypothetical protein GY816_16105 [Cytophagales bacterium]|nr:hypothetical protein [Cytophagales bacterium]